VTDVFEYEGYKIPVELVEMTGGGPDTWDVISVGHMDQYERYCPILADHDVLEIGCGVGRDAIQLTRTLSPAGSYVGVDIIRPSIEWCQGNITTRFPNFRFEYLDIHSQIHNPVGTAAVTEVTLPVADDSIDRIVLQSVFTHMFEGDIVHYLHEFRRVLRPGGRVFASLFLLDDESLRMARASGKDAGSLTFRVPYGDGCLINDERFPEGAVGYTPAAFERILSAGGFELEQPIHRGFWCGRQGVPDGQDIAVLRPVGGAGSTRGRVRRFLHRRVPRRG
jgi:SAM-dependent methyltransferase